MQIQKLKVNKIQKNVKAVKNYLLEMCFFAVVNTVQGNQSKHLKREINALIISLLKVN